MRPESLDFQQKDLPPKNCTNLHNVCMTRAAVTRGLWFADFFFMINIGLKSNAVNCS